MAGETVITVVGNLTADPEIRTIGSGAAVASFTIASTPRTWNRNSNQFEDGQALFLRCSAWRDMAEHCAQSLSKGMRVIAQGRLQQRSYQAQDGSQRTVIEMQVDEIGPSLRSRDRPGDPSKLVRQRRLQRQSRRLQQRQQQRRFRRQQRRISGWLQLCWRRRISGWSLRSGQCRSRTVRSGLGPVVKLG